MYELPPEHVIVIDAVFANRGRTETVKSFHITRFTLVLRDHYLRDGRATEFQSFDGTVYTMTYDNQA